MTSYKVSASQIKTAFDQRTGCLRKWAFYKIDDIRTPSTSSQALGSGVHTVAENYLRDGTIPDLKTKHGRIFAAGMHLLPPRDQVTAVEQEFNLRFNDDVTFYGFIDFMGERFVGDHKTTSNLKYMLTPEELVRDPQAVIYGMYLAKLRKMGLGDKLSLHWNYYCTVGSPYRAKAVKVDTMRVQLENAYYPIAEQASKLVQLRKEADRAIDVEPNFNSCGAYGGCPHIAKCDKQPAYAGITTNTDQEGTDMSALLQQLQARAKAAQTAKAETKQPEPTVAKPEVIDADTVQINPPEVTKKASKKDKMTSLDELKAIVAEKKEEPVVAEAPVVKRKGGRPKGSKNKPKATAAVKAAMEEVATADPADCTPAPQVTVEPVESQSATAGYTLYINCIPSCGGVDITKRLREIAKKCATDNNVDDYRFIRFGEGPARFSKSVIDALLEEPLHGKIVVESSNLMVKDCIEVLIEHATEVVRAIR